MTRLTKEQQNMLKKDAKTLTLNAVDSNTWFVSFEGAPGTVYAGEKFRLRFRFNSNYVDSPADRPARGGLRRPTPDPRARLLQRLHLSLDPV